MDKLSTNTQNVVTMSDYQPDTGYSAIAQIEAYWDALRGDRLMPKRADIDPRGIEQALEYAFIVERIAPGIARLRIAGSHLSDLMGMEVRGMPLTSLFTPNVRRQVSDTLEEVFETPALAHLRLYAEGGAGRPPVEGRMVLLPLKSDLGDVSRILGCLVSHGELGHAPRRFDIQQSQLRAIVPGRGPVPARPALKPAPAKADLPPISSLTRGFGEGPRPFKAKSGKTRPPYLRLVKSDD